MKRNIILLATVLLSSIILWMTYALGFSGKFDTISKNRRMISIDYEKYLNHKIIRDAKHPTSDKMLARNIDNGKKNDPVYFGQGIINQIGKLIEKNIPRAKKIFIISDKKVPPQALKKLNKS